MIEHGRQRLIEAVRELVIGPGLLDLRMDKAIERHLSEIRPMEDLPAQYRDDFLATVEAAPDQPTLREAIARMSDRDREKIAGKIVDLAFRVNALAAAA